MIFLTSTRQWSKQLSAPQDSSMVAQIQNRENNAPTSKCEWQSELQWAPKLFFLKKLVFYTEKVSPHFELDIFLSNSKLLIFYWSYIWEHRRGVNFVLQQFWWNISRAKTTNANRSFKFQCARSFSEMFKLGFDKPRAMLLLLLFWMISGYIDISLIHIVQSMSFQDNVKQIEI